MPSEESLFIRPTLVKYRDITSIQSLNESRQAWDRLAREIKDLPSITFVNEELGHRPCLRVSHDHVQPGKIILYCHGGGYVSGSLDTHRDMVSRLSLASDTEVLLVDYRLAPEFPFPAGLQDILDVYHDLLQHGFREDDVVFAGDSAGGGLVVGALLKLKSEQRILPKSYVLLSPWLDLTMGRESAKIWAESDPALNLDELKTAVGYYLVDQSPLLPYASPIFGDLSDFPPGYVQVGTDEILLNDSVDFVKSVRDLGGRVELDVWDDMWHFWHAWSSILPEGQDAIDEVGEFIWEMFSE